MAEKMRVHILAKELNVPSKVIIEKCKAEGITSVKNHMSTLTAGLHATISEWFSEGGHDTTVETAQRVDLKKVRIQRRRKKATTATAQEGQKKGTGRKKAAAKTDDARVAVAEAEPAAQQPPALADQSAAPVTAVAEAPPVTDAKPAIPPEEVFPQPADVSPEAKPSEQPTAGETVKPADEESPPTAVATEAKAAAEAPKPERTPIAPVGPQNIPTKAKLQGPRVVRYESPDYDVGPARRRSGSPRRAVDTGPRPGTTEPGPPGVAPPADRGPADRGPARRKSRLSPRRASGRVAETSERLSEWRDQDVLERRERLAGATGRRIHRRRSAQGGTATAPPVPAGPKTRATVHEPVRVKEFCSATGLNFMQCFKVLRDEHSLVANVNMTLPTETAELLALHFGIELEVIPSKTRLDELREEFAARERKHLEPRPPVVTMLGHVDHGKTSLLDAVRRTRVVAGEDGGITQHIGAYHIETEHGAVTFLDTPGHEAFTAMRARGAQLTDVVVLVVAADDGVMPQTIEAINHAKAAEVPIVVALNKIDLGADNKLKIYGQLAEHGVTPTGEWGGDVDVIATSATTGEGVRELVEHLAELSSLLDLKADRTQPATGTVIEAETKPGVGAVARVLAQEGTLRVGDFVVCGPAFGKVRALLDDRGRRIEEAGPSIPVEVWGLDDVPAAGDRLYTVENLQRAKDIATETKQARLERSRVQSRKIHSLEEMFLRRDSEEVPELNVVIKADVDGSVSALRRTLEELPSEEVRLTIRHAGVGAVNDSDVFLAADCKGIIVAFRVDASSGVRRLAEQNGVDIRSYRVIYNVRDDIKKGLEGLLAPEEHIKSRGKAEVRQLFKLSRKLGTVAGSYVTEGVIDRSHLVKVIRNDVVVREGCRFGSLRRFKDDIKEVRAGLECGIRVEGFDDIHVGDIIEAYEIVKVARTL